MKNRSNTNQSPEPRLTIMVSQTTETSLQQNPSIQLRYLSQWIVIKELQSQEPIKSLCSAIYSISPEMGLHNQRKSMQAYTEKSGKTLAIFYVDASMERQIYKGAPVELKDAMDLAYLTDQRPADVLKMSSRTSKDNALEVARTKHRSSFESCKRKTGQIRNLARVIGRASGLGRERSKAFSYWRHRLEHL